MWSIPKEWNERCFILGGGPSLDPEIVKQLTGHIIAINEAVVDRPDADVLYWADPQWARREKTKVEAHTGTYKISRRLKPSNLKCEVKLIDWALPTGKDRVRGLSTDPTKIGGYCSGGNALNLAFLFGANPIILLGFDMRIGEITVRGETHTIKNYHTRYQRPPDDSQYVKKFMKHIISMAPEIARHGVKVYNTSLNSRLECFPKVNIREFLK